MSARGTHGRSGDPYRLDPVLEGLLAVAFAPAVDAEARWRAFRAGVDLDDLWDGRAVDLLPLVYRALVDAGADHPDLARLRGVHRRAWYENQVRFHRLAGVLGALSGAGIEHLVLKGVPMALLEYRDAGLRPMRDVDVLVRPGQVGRALEVLTDLGWSAPSALPRNFVRHHATDCVHDGAWLDLHWHVSLWLLAPGHEWHGDDPFWARARPLTVAGAPTQALDPTDALLHTVLHAANGGWAAAPQWVPDARRLIGDGTVVDWDRLVRTATAHRVGYPLSRGLRYLGALGTGAIPSGVCPALEAGVSGSDRRRFDRAARGLAPTPAESRWLGPGAHTYRYWVRVSAPYPRGAAIREFPRWLADHWGLDHPWVLPLDAARRVARQVASRARGLRAGQ